MPNKWTDWVRKWADDHKMTYPCAIKDPACKAGYTKVPKPIMNRNIYGNPDKVRKKRASIADPANANKTSTEKRHEWEDKNDPAGAEARKAFRDERDSVRRLKKDQATYAKRMKAKEELTKIAREANKQMRNPAQIAYDTAKDQIGFSVRGKKKANAETLYRMKLTGDLIDYYRKGKNLDYYPQVSSAGMDEMSNLKYGTKMRNDYHNVFFWEASPRPYDNRPKQQVKSSVNFYTDKYGKRKPRLEWIGGQFAGQNGWDRKGATYASYYKLIPADYIKAYDAKDDAKMIEMIQQLKKVRGRIVGWGFNGSFGEWGEHDV